MDNWTTALTIVGAIAIAVALFHHFRASRARIEEKKRQFEAEMERHNNNHRARIAQIERGPRGVSQRENRNTTDNGDFTANSLLQGNATTTQMVGDGLTGFGHKRVGHTAGTGDTLSTAPTSVDTDSGGDGD